MAGKSNSISNAAREKHGETAGKLQKLSAPGRWDELEPIFNSTGMTPEWAIHLLRECCEIEICDSNGRPIPNAVKARVRALETWAKWSGYQPPERIFVSKSEFDIDFAERGDGDGE